MDPNYKLPELTLNEINRRNEREKQEQIEHATNRINEDFHREMEQREQHIKDIQTKITCVAKTLHVLRYVLVSNYYNGQDTQLPPVEDELNIVDKQNRLHPAIKQIVNEQTICSLDFKKRSSRRTTKPITVAPIQDNITIDESKKSTENLVVSDVQPRLETHCEAPRKRQMSRHKVIVGNISKYMPSENPDDKSTHKWMVYVRGPPDNPRIDDFVEKVIFHLHPSYHPHDVIEVKDHPFHLSRRGWGEFLMRCQLVFKLALNKPVDLIHQLTLDKTHSGRQRLGKETVFELTLYVDKLKDEPMEEDSVKPEPLQIDTPEIIKQEPITNMKIEISDEFTIDPHSDFINNQLTNDNIELLEASHPIKAEHELSCSYEYCLALVDHNYAIRSVK